MYTLKEEGKRGVVTIAAKKGGKVNYYIEGKGGIPGGEQNIKPDKQYWPMIEDLLKQENITGYEPSTSYNKQVDYTPDDMSPELKAKFEETDDFLKNVLPGLNEKIRNSKDDEEIKSLIEQGAEIPKKRILEFVKKGLADMDNLDVEYKKELFIQALKDIHKQKKAA